VAVQTVDADRNWLKFPLNLQWSLSQYRKKN